MLTTAFFMSKYAAATSRRTASRSEPFCSVTASTRALASADAPIVVNVSLRIQVSRSPASQVMSNWSRWGKMRGFGFASVASAKASRRGA